MKILVTGSAGHLGEALVRTLAPDHEVVGLDVIDSAFTQVVGTITDRDIVESCMDGVDCVLHTATLHKPHVLTHTRQQFIDTNLKVNEYLYRRVDIADAANAHTLAMQRAAVLGFGKYIISASTPFKKEDLRELRTDAPHVVERLFPDYTEEYARRGWKMVPGIDRVYVNARARNDLDWQPCYDFGYVLSKLQANEDYRSPLAVAVGAKGYHAQAFTDGPYPVTQR